jgi:hypothetical protein
MLCVQRQPYLGPVPFPHSQATMDISLLLKPKDEEENQSAKSAAASTRSASVPRSVVSTPSLALHPPSTSSVPVKRLSSSQAHPSESPAQKTVEIVARRRCEDYRTPWQRDEMGGHQQAAHRSKCYQLSPSLPELS